MKLVSQGLAFFFIARFYFQKPSIKVNKNKRVFIYLEDLTMFLISKIKR